MQRLRGSDAYTVYGGTPRSPFVTMKVAIYKPTPGHAPPGRDEVRQFITDGVAGVGVAHAGLRVIRVPLDLHHPVWVRAPGFSLDDHLFEVELPAPGNKAQLSDFLSDLMGRPLKEDRPLWEVWIVNGLEHDRVAIVFKVHHALADGKMMARLIELTHGDSSGAAFGKRAEQEWIEEPLPGKLRLIGGALKDLAKSYTVELPHFYRHLQESRRKDSPLDSLPENPVKAFAAPFTALDVHGDSSERIYRYETFSLADFKALSREYDCTINTVVLGICAEALKQYLDLVDQAPEESLVTSIAIGGQVGNQYRSTFDSRIHNNNMAVAYVPLYQNIADFGQRLQAIQQAVRTTVDHVKYGDGRRFDNYLDFMPGTAARLVNRMLCSRQAKRKRPMANLVISNVPGPRERLYAADGRLEMDELLSVGNLVDAANLNITVWSYVDNMTFSFYFRKDAIPQPEKLVEFTRTVVSNLLEEKLRKTA